jgi:cytochrome P450
MAGETMKFPPDVHNQVMMNHIADKYDLRKYGLFYIDSYPIQCEPVLVIIAPDVAAQVTQTESYPKHPILAAEFGRAIGPRGIVEQEGEQWKELRTMFNPGFSQANLLSMVPMMVEETTIFVNRLSGIAAGDGFIQNTNDLAAAVTVDIIGQALLGVRFNAQTTSNALVTSVVQASHLSLNVSDMSPERLNIWRNLKLRYHEAVSNKKIADILSTKWAELATASEKPNSSNAIFDIAMAKYMKRGGSLTDGLTSDFLDLMRDK